MPPTPDAQVRAAVAPALRGLEGPALVACSGGADSLALLTAAVTEGRALGTPVVGVVVDHGLQEGSAEHTARVVRQMAAAGADETVSERVQVRATGRGVEAAAREARYALLEQVARRVGSGLVLLGHTLDDQAETVLLGLTRGSGGRSLAGMRPAFGVFRRPLLGVRRADTEAACAALGLDYWCDPHNADPRFTRSRVRHAVLPFLERELGPGVTEALARTAEQLRPDTETLDELADRARADALADSGTADERLAAPVLDTEAVTGLPTSLRTRVLRRAALDAGALPGELTHGHVLALDSLVAGTVRGQVQLPGHVTAELSRHRLRFRPTVVES